MYNCFDCFHCHFQCCHIHIYIQQIQLVDIEIDEENDIQTQLKKLSQQIGWMKHLMNEVDLNGMELMYIVKTLNLNQIVHHMKNQPRNKQMNQKTLSRNNGKHTSVNQQPISNRTQLLQM